MTLVWDANSISECPGCGRTIVVGIMSLSATCPIDGYYYVTTMRHRAWFTSRKAYQRGDAPIYEFTQKESK